MVADGGATRRTEVELVREAPRLRQLEDEWRRLAVGRGNAFVTPEWFWCWMRHYGGGHEPLVGAVHRADGSLRGVLPLVRAARGSAPARFAGSGLGDSFHPAAEEADETAVAAKFGRALAVDPRRPQALVLENVATDASWWPELIRAGGWPRDPVTVRDSILPSAPLGGRSWSQYLASRSRNLRSQIGRRHRALDREHNVRVRWTGADDDVEREIALLFRLHDARWRARADRSSLSSERARAFHADFAAAISQRGWLRLAFLELDRHPVAAWYGWRVGNRFAYYQAGFDPAWADRSVGFVLFCETIRRAAEEEATEYDMLLGGEPFKLRFADVQRPVCTILAAPRLSSTRLLGAVEARLRASARRLPESVRAPTKRRARALLTRLPLARRR